MDSSREPLRAAIVGFGRIAKLIHCPLLIEERGWRLVGIVDVVPIESAPSDVETFASVADLLAAQRVDALFVCSPPSQHLQALQAAAKQGVAVYVEKPLVVSMTDALLVRELEAELPEWKCCVGFNYRFDQGFDELARSLRACLLQQEQKNRLGELVSVASTFSSSARTLPEWKRSQDRGGGALWDLGSHHLDLLRHFFGGEITVSSVRVESRLTEADGVVVQSQLGAGIHGAHRFQFGSIDQDRWWVYGSLGAWEYDRLSGEAPRYHPVSRQGENLRAAKSALSSLTDATARALRLRDSGALDSYRSCFSAFETWIRTDLKDPRLADVEDGLQCAAAILSVQEEVR